VRPRDRLIWSALALASLAVLVTARLLVPAASGVGTHLALGLPPCGFLLWSGLPCPACGLTTSFAWLARAELTRGLQANPLGLPLFLGTLLTLVLATRYAYLGRARDTPWLVVDRYRVDKVALGVVVALLLSWCVRLLALSLR
jgi:hypothetical protein